jgi:hypothetical protein
VRAFSIFYLSRPSHLSPLSLPTCPKRSAFPSSLPFSPLPLVLLPCYIFNNAEYMRNSPLSILCDILERIVLLLAAHRNISCRWLPFTPRHPLRRRKEIVSLKF